MKHSRTYYVVAAIVIVAIVVTAAWFSTQPTEQPKGVTSESEPSYQLRFIFKDALLNESMYGTQARPLTVDILNDHLTQTWEVASSWDSDYVETNMRYPNGTVAYAHVYVKGYYDQWYKFIVGGPLYLARANMDGSGCWSSNTIVNLLTIGEVGTYGIPSGTFTNVDVSLVKRAEWSDIFYGVMGYSGELIAASGISNMTIRQNFTFPIPSDTTVLSIILGLKSVGQAYGEPMLTVRNGEFTANFLTVWIEINSTDIQPSWSLANGFCLLQNRQGKQVYYTFLQPIENWENGIYGRSDFNIKQFPLHVNGTRSQVLQLKMWFSDLQNPTLVQLGSPWTILPYTLTTSDEGVILPIREPYNNATQPILSFYLKYGDE